MLTDLHILRLTEKRAQLPAFADSHRLSRRVLRKVEFDVPRHLGGTCAGLLTE